MIEILELFKVLGKKYFFKNLTSILSPEITKLFLNKHENNQQKQDKIRLRLSRMWEICGDNIDKYK